MLTSYLPSTRSRAVRAAAIVLFVVLFFVVCWTPAITLAQISSVDRQLATEQELEWTGKRISKIETDTDKWRGGMEARLAAVEKETSHSREIEATARALATFTGWLFTALGGAIMLALRWAAKKVVDSITELKGAVAQNCEDQNALRKTMKAEIAKSRYKILNVLGIPLVKALGKDHPDIAEALASDLGGHEEDFESGEIPLIVPRGLGRK